MILRFRRSRELLIGALALMTAVTACSGSSSNNGSSTSSNSGPVKLTWWHNANQDPGMSFWQTVANEYHAAHPNVTIDVVPIQNEQFTTKIPVALQSQDPPDVYQQWGGGQLADQVAAGKVKDITNDVKPWVGSLGSTVDNWKVNGKQYGIPYSLGLVGFWYNKDLFAKASIAQPPATWDDFLADISKLKAAGIAPIALGAKDKWPDAFYWDYLAVRMCSKKTLQQTASDFKFTDSCWTQAGAKVKQLLDAQPFENGFLGVPAQQGAGSSAGLIGNGKAAMELQGHWDPGVMQGLTPDQKGLGDKLGWFPFPTVPGGNGQTGAVLGGGDGYSCSYKAPPQCADFLKYLASVDVQKRWAGLNVGLPVAQGADSGIADPNLRNLIEIRNKTPFLQLYLDIAFPTSVGQALDDAIANQFAGSATPDQVVKTISDAAKNR
jgi:raffinose/stachyose/melibiose transport system substrate-binding protein